MGLAGVFCNVGRGAIDAPKYANPGISCCLSINSVGEGLRALPYIYQ